MALPSSPSTNALSTTTTTTTTVASLDGTLRYLFDSYDTDNDGWLRQTDFNLFLWDLKCAGSSKQMPVAQMQRCWAVIDRYRVGRIRLEQFLVGVAWLTKHQFVADAESVPSPEPLPSPHSSDAASPLTSHAPVLMLASPARPAYRSGSNLALASISSGLRPSPLGSSSPRLAVASPVSSGGPSSGNLRGPAAGTASSGAPARAAGATPAATASAAGGVAATAPSAAASDGAPVHRERSNSARVQRFVTTPAFDRTSAGSADAINAAPKRPSLDLDTSKQGRPGDAALPPPAAPDRGPRPSWIPFRKNEKTASEVSRKTSADRLPEPARPLPLPPLPAAPPVATTASLFVRVYADNSQYRTVTVPVTATAEDVLRAIGPKFELAGDLDRYMLYISDDVTPRDGELPELEVTDPKLKVMLLEPTGKRLYLGDRSGNLVPLIGGAPTTVADKKPGTIRTKLFGFRK